MDPATIRHIRQGLLKWYRRHRRLLPWRQTHDPYAIWVSEVMLQQTQVATVVPYYRRFLNRFASIDQLAAADLEPVLKAWEGLGYYARARNLHRAAQIVSATYAGQIPTDWQAFRSLPGVGDYIAAAVLSIAFDQAHPVVDGNVKRVLARLRLIDTPVNSPSAHKAFQPLAARLLDPGQPGDFNQAVMELGALVCTPRNPKCPTCPIQVKCRAAQGGQTREFPKRAARRTVPHYRIAAGVVFKNGRVLITRRQPSGLLGGLWEFPGGKIGPSESSVQACIREIKEEVNLNVEVTERLTTVKHAYTHFSITLEVFICRYRGGRVRLSGPEAFRWITMGQIDSFPFPKANAKFIPLLKEKWGSNLDY